MLIETVHHDYIAGYVANQHIDWTNATQDILTTGDLTLGDGATIGIVSDDDLLTLTSDNLTIAGSLDCGLLTNAGAWTWTGNTTADWSDAPKVIDIQDSGGVVFRNGGGSLLELIPAVPILFFGNITGNPAYSFRGSGLTTLGGNLLVNGGNIGITADTDIIVLSDANKVFIDQDIIIKAGSFTSLSDAISFGNENLSTTGNMAASTYSNINIVAPEAILTLRSTGTYSTIIFDRGNSDNFEFRMRSEGTFFRVSNSEDNGSSWQEMFTLGRFTTDPLLTLTGRRPTIKTNLVDTSGTGISVSFFDPYITNNNTTINAGRFAFFGSLNQGGTPSVTYWYIDPRSTPSHLAPIFKLSTNGLGIGLASTTSPSNPLQVNGITQLGDGGVANYTQISSTGNITQMGSATAVLLQLEVTNNVGFFGTTPVSQNQLQTGVGASVDNVITELQRLGLVRQAA